MKEKIVNKICDKIVYTLNHFNLSYMKNEDGEAMSLIDALSAGSETVESGIAELSLMIDVIFMDLMELKE